MRYATFAEEKKLWKKGYKWVAGIDEAGRGPLAGPVVAAAVILKNPKSEIPASPAGGRNPKQIQNFKYQNLKHVSNFVLRALDLKLRDSKQLSQKQREFFYKIITKDPSMRWGVGIVPEKVIDKINILEATKLAIVKALKKLSPKIDFLILDGNIKINYPVLQKLIIKGDEKVFSCAAASIIAKVTRDRIMLRYHKKYPCYHFNLHKGYGTKLHYRLIKENGPCKIHRRSFNLLK